MSATKAFDRRWATAAIDPRAAEPTSGEHERRPRDSVVDLVGRTLGGKFRVEALVGTGAMGNVYRATHVVLDKSVAVKVIRAAYSSSEVFRKRFLQEALTASRLEHANTVQVLDYGTEPDGVTYIVMELLRGRTLADLIDRERRLPPERIVAVMSQVLSAIATAHDAGIIHRDLKPENVMLVPQKVEDANEVTDVVKVMDFGIAAVVDGSEWSKSADRPTDEAIMGTPGYMSPEQLRGTKLDARSDVYACGVILFELLTGRPPFVADNVPDLVLMALSEEPPHPRDVDPACDPALADVIARALRPDREERFPSARALRTALREAVANRGSGEVAREVVASIEPARGAPRREPVETLVDPEAAAEVAAAAAEAPSTPTVATPSPAPMSNSRARWIAATIMLAVPIALAAFAVRTHVARSHSSAAAANAPRIVRHEGPPSVRPEQATARNERGGVEGRSVPARTLQTAPSSINVAEPATPPPERTDRVAGATRDTPATGPTAARAMTLSEAGARHDASPQRTSSRDARARAHAPTRGELSIAVAAAEATDSRTASRVEEAHPEPAAPIAATAPPAPAHVDLAVVNAAPNPARAVPPPSAPPPARIPRAATAVVETLQASAGAPRAPLASRGQRAAEALARCASREVSARGAAAGLDATRRVRLVIDVRDERLDDLRLQGGPAWVGACSAALRDSFAGALPAADDAEYTVTVDIALSPQM